MSAERYSIDTNLLVYAVDRREGAKHLRALEIVDCSVERDCILTAQSLAEFVMVAARRRMLAKHEAISQARDWMRVLPVVTADASAFERAFAAFEAGRFGLWDAVLLATARAAGCTILLERGHAGRRRVRRRRGAQSVAGRPAARGSGAAAGVRLTRQAASASSSITMPGYGLW